MRIAFHLYGVTLGLLRAEIPVHGIDWFAAFAKCKDGALVFLSALDPWHRAARVEDVRKPLADHAPLLDGRGMQTRAFMLA